MSQTAHEILDLVRRSNYAPLKLKALARKLGVPSSDYSAIRDTVKGLIQQGRLELGKNRTIRQPDPHGTVTGVFRGIRSGGGFVRPQAQDGSPLQDVFVGAANARDAAT